MVAVGLRFAGAPRVNPFFLESAVPARGQTRSVFCAVVGELSLKLFESVTDTHATCPIERPWLFESEIGRPNQRRASAMGLAAM